MFKKIEKILIKFIPKFYLKLTRAQDSNDRFIFGSDFIKKNKTNSLISVLDIGCGGGNFFAYINSDLKNSEYLGIDFDDGKMKKSKFDDFENFKTICKDLRTDWYYNKHDFVWSSEVIEHLFDDQSFFKKLVKSTKKGGYIIITTPYYNSYLNFAKKYNWSIKPSKEEITGHVRLGYSENDLKKLAIINNVELEDIYYISECSNFRAKNFFKLNNGLFCYFFNILYIFKFLKYERYIKGENALDKINYFSIAAVYKNRN